MIEQGTNPWRTVPVDAAVIDRLASVCFPHERAVALGVDIVGDPHREDDDGYNWTRLSCARNARDVTPGSAVILGSGIGHYVAKVVAWDFEVSDDDPIVVLDVVPLRADVIGRALARCGSSVAEPNSRALDDIDDLGPERHHESASCRPSGNLEY
jgi:hypothetical protein